MMMIGGGCGGGKNDNRNNNHAFKFKYINITNNIGIIHERSKIVGSIY